MTQRQIVGVLMMLGLMLNGCRPSTPQVGRIETQKVRAGAVLHVEGKNFGTDPSRVAVTLGHAAAHVRSVSEDSIDVVLPQSLEAGTYPLVITNRKNNRASEPVDVHVTEVVRIPARSKLWVKTTQSFGSETSRTGDTVMLILNDPLIVKERVAAEQGSEVVGRVTHVQEPGKVKGRAAIGFTLTELKRGADSLPLSTDEFYRVAPSTVKRDVETIGITTGVGTLIGALAGGGKGAAIGAAVGGGAGTGAVLLTKGKQVVIPTGHVYEFTLEKTVEFEIAQPLPRPAATKQKAQEQ